MGPSPSGGANSYREHGLLGVGFGGSALPVFFSAGSEPVLHEDWNLAEPGLWHETHPRGMTYPATPEGLAQAHQDMEREAFWRNLPGCLLGTWVEVIPGPPAEGDLRWFHLELDGPCLLGEGEASLVFADRCEVAGTARWSSAEP